MKIFNVIIKKTLALWPPGPLALLPLMPRASCLIPLFLCLLWFTLSANSANAQKTVAPKPVKIAIINKPGQYDDRGLKVLDLFQGEMISTLSKIENINMIEREEIQKVLKEHQLSQTGSEPLEIGRLLGADLFLCFSITKEEVHTEVEVLVLEINSANVVYSIKQKLTKDPEKSAEEAAAKITGVYQEIVAAIEKNKDKPTAAVLYVNNNSKLHRLDYLETVFIRKIEDTIQRTGKYLLLRRQYANIASKETELSYSGWIRPSDAAIAKYADVIVSLEYKEKYKAGLGFMETPLVVNVTIEGRKIKRQTFSIVDTVTNISKILEQLQKNLLQRMPKIKLYEDKDTAARKEEALSLYNAFLKLTDNREKYFTGAKSERIMQMLEKAVYLDPELKMARYYLSGCYLVRAQKDNSGIRKRADFLRKAIEEKEKSLPIEFKSGPFYLRPGKLIDHYSYLAYYLTILGKREGKSYDDEILGLYRKQYKYILQTVMQIPPEQQGFNIGLKYPVNYFLHEKINDIDGAVKWFVFVEKLIGKKYFQNKKSYFLHRDNCPPLIAALALYKHAPEKALWFYERAEKEHRELFEQHGPMIRDSVLSIIYKELGDKKKLANIKKKSRQKHNKSNNIHRFVDSFSESPVKNIPQKKFPVNVLKSINGLPENAELFAYHKDKTLRYYVAGVGPNCSKQCSVEELRKIAYRNYYIIQTSGNGSVINKIPIFKKGKPVRITTVVPWKQNIWFGTASGVSKFNTSTNEYELFTISNGLPFDNVSCGMIADGLLWFGTGVVGKRYWDASLFSMDPETLQVKSYLPNVKVRGGVLDIMDCGGRILAICQGAFYWINKKTGAWAKLKNGYATSCPIKHDGNILIGTGTWAGTEKGLGIIQGRKIENRFSIGPIRQVKIYYEAGGQTGGFSLLRIPGKNPIYGKVTALASNGAVLWIASEKRLVAYDFSKDIWYGPFIWPARIRNLQFDNGRLIIFGKKTGVINAEDFFNEAKKADIVWTSEQYKKEIDKRYRDAGSYALALRALLTHEKRETVITLLDKAFKDNPEDMRPLFWKAEYLRKLKPSEFSGAIKIYDSILVSGAPEHIKNLAKIEKKYVIETSRKHKHRKTQKLKK